MKEHRGKTGFTLIELLIVVAIIAILAAIAVPNFLEAQVRAKVARVRADLQALMTAVETYNIDNSKFPLHMTVNQLGNGIKDPYLGEPGEFSWPYGEYHFSRKSHITTPVAYITQVPLDPFYKLGAPVDFQNATATNGKEEARKEYLYATTKHVSGSKENSWAAYGAWRLSSGGPDLTRRDIYLRSSKDAMRIYEPTNGTISTGDIWRTHKSTDGSRPNVAGVVD